MTDKPRPPAKGPQLPQKKGKPNAVSVYSVGPIAKPVMQKPGAPQNVPLPRAVAVYGAAAAVFAVLTIFYFIRGQWWTGLIMILPTFCLAGFTWYYLKASATKPW
ncbi:MAG TPA: hypothetical protein VHB73_06600 [Alphaproteobacteria bacterium]|nr:hypothetical protein [Alphaproteobacteria bacterium]